MSLCTLPIEDILHLTLFEVEKAILAAERVCAGSLTLRDLAAHSTHPNGVYIFFQKGDVKPFYIGRASSRSFIGRLPSHFEPHVDFWMNGLSKGIQGIDGCSYQEGLEKALCCDLLLIGFQYPEQEEDFLLRRQRINALELVLQRYLQPTITSRCSSFTGQEVLASLLPTKVRPSRTIKRGGPGKPDGPSHINR